MTTTQNPIDLGTPALRTGTELVPTI
ncbi:hypothetical protein L615_002800000540, partial [Nocardioides sp. J9]